MTARPPRRGLYVRFNKPASSARVFQSASYSESDARNTWTRVHSITTRAPRSSFTYAGDLTSARADGAGAWLGGTASFRPTGTWTSRFAAGTLTGSFVARFDAGAKPLATGGFASLNRF